MKSGTWDVDILGVRVSAVNMAMALQRLSNLVEEGTSNYVCVTGVHGVIESQGNAELLNIHNNASLVTPDGMPTVWSGKWAGAHWMSRVYGPDLLLAVCENGLQRGWCHYFYGGSPGVAETLAARLVARFPGLQVAGWESPPFRSLDDSDLEAVAQRLRPLEPDFVWIGLSTPKQEQVASQLSHIWPGPIFIGVGAAFDFHAGLKRQAPPVVQRLGLEWLFRMVTEPRRLARRYLSMVPRFLVAIVRRPPSLTERQT